MRQDGAQPPADPAPGPAAPRTRTVDVHRYGPDAVVLDVHLGQYREVFFVLTGDKSVTITMLDGSDPTHHEAQVFVFAKPWQWSLDAPDEEVLLRVWQSVGVQR
ncbi:hypothetical protein [Frankia tisae]|uniref:hypothetical protein n=1 Tax=Frankia tisae TaxID=2950104 RepID=UPI0021C13118|nr:hypothetical protein [Frankia tisae]